MSVSASPPNERTIRFRVLPLRLVVAGRFGLAAGRLHRLDVDGAGGLLERAAPTLVIKIADRLRADGTEVTAQFTFRHRRDFAPGAVAQAIPDLQRLLDVHRALRSGASLAALRDGLADLPAARAALAPGSVAPAAPAPVQQPSPAARAVPSSDDAIDRLLDMVEAPPSSGSPVPQGDPARTALSSFISEVARGSTRPVAADLRPEALEAVVAKQISAVLDHPEFRAIEGAWAALRLLARRIDLRAAVTVDVIEAGRDSVADALETLVPEDDPDPKGPVRIVLDLNDYDATDRDIGRLRRLAAFGESRRAVVLANVAPEFANADDLAAMHDPQTRFEESCYSAWNNLRDTAEAGWLGLCLSRIALRDATDDKALRFAGNQRIGRPLDAGAASTVAALLATAAAETDWPCALGTVVEPVVDNLVLVQDGTNGFLGPVRPALSTSAADSLAAAGLITLVAERGRDTARLPRLPSVRRPGRRDEDEASLLVRLFQAQVVHGLQWNADRLFDTSNHTALRDRVEAYFAALAASSGPGAGAEVRLDCDEEGLPILAVHVRSGARAAPGAAIAFDVPLGSSTAGAIGEQ